MAVDLANADVLVTGGTGFIGSSLVDDLIERGANIVVVDDNSRGDPSNLDEHSNLEFIEGDLVDRSLADEVTNEVEYCFHLAAVVGDVSYMSSNPHQIFRNLVIDYNVLEGCRMNNVEKMLYVSSACVYPIDLQEEDYALLAESDTFENGVNPDGDYGWTKTVGEQMVMSYSEQFNIDIPIVRPFNPYGPRESFDPDDSHVIPAFIRRAAREESPFTVWGSGEQVRTFTYVKDLTAWMIKAIQHLEGGEPVNLSSDDAVTIAELAETVLETTSHKADIEFDTTKPEGVKVRKPDITKAKSKLGIQQGTPLKEGIRRTYEWYLENEA